MNMNMNINMKMHYDSTNPGALAEALYNAMCSQRPNFAAGVGLGVSPDVYSLMTVQIPTTAGSVEFCLEWNEDNQANARFLLNKSEDDATGCPVVQGISYAVQQAIVGYTALPNPNYNSRVQPVAPNLTRVSRTHSAPAASLSKVVQSSIREVQALRANAGHYQSSCEYQSLSAIQQSIVDGTQAMSSVPADLDEQIALIEQNKEVADFLSKVA